MFNDFLSSAEIERFEELFAELKKLVYEIGDLELEMRREIAENLKRESNSQRTIWLLSVRSKRPVRIPVKNGFPTGFT